MNAPLPRSGVRTTCPYCGVGCGVDRPPRTGAAVGVSGDPEPSGEFRPAVLQGTPRSAKRWRSTGACFIRCCGEPDGTLARASWDGALATRGGRFPAHRRARRSRRRRILSLGPAADGGLLRRQQADEGLHRLGQCRHQFAAVHGVVGRRPPACVRRRHRARRLCRSRRSRSDRAGRLEHRLVPSGAVSAHGRESDAARRQDRRHRSAPHRDCRRCRSVPVRSRRAWTRRCSAACWSISPNTGALDHGYIDAHTTSFGERARPCARDRPRCGGDRGRDRARCKRRRKPSSNCSRATPRVVTCFSQGVNQSAQGTDKVNAIINCHLATGRIGKPGMGPFSLTGQPNAMGGREVGGLANQLAAHMDFRAARYRPRVAASGTRRIWRHARD